MRYYCHQCHTQINADELLPDFRCPSCQSGFIEEIATQSASPATAHRDSSADDSTLGRGITFREFISSRLSSDEFSDDNSDVEFVDAVNSPLAQVFNLFQPQTTQPPNSDTTTATTNNPSQSNQAAPTQSDSPITRPQTRLITRSQNNSSARGSGQDSQMQAAYIDRTANQTIADVLNDFITGVSFGYTNYPSGSTSNAQGAGRSGQPSIQGASVARDATRGLINIDFPLPFFLHSNPGDYAWGNAGFDAVITELLNNLDGSNSGPPPMPKEQIHNLSTVKITEEQVRSSNLQCTVCMDDFQVGDSARQLPCEHFFHQDCILPWLQLHASCPICRKTFVANSGTGSQAAATTTTTQTTNPSDNSRGTHATTATTPTSTAASNNLSSGSSATTARDVSALSTTNTSANTPVTNPNTTPKGYDYTEDDCD